MIHRLAGRGLITRRNMLAVGGSALIAAPFVQTSAQAQGRIVYVNSYGGVWETTWKKAFFDPFTAQTGIQIKTVPGVSFAKLKAQVQTRNYQWDVVNLGDVEYGQAVLESLLEKVDKAAAKTDQLPPNIVRDYAITSYSLGTNLVYRKDKFPNGGPQSWADFWNVKKYPGQRCLFDRSFTCLAFALLADGVPKDKLYPMDIDRAFRKMDELKPHIKTWWRDGSQSQQLIRDGEVDMIAMWSARAVDLIDDKVPLELVWNESEIYKVNLVIPRGDPRAKETWEFCNFVAQAKPQAEFAMMLPYGPANPAARALMTEARLKLTPAWPEHEKISFTHDVAWIAPRLPQIRERWTQWLAT
jgi:putative spermidine/putrescine transport system substrate-binding protein